MDERADMLRNWVAEQITRPFDFRPASDDASFRRYFRVRFDQCTLIAADAPPNKEDSRPFIEVSQRLLAAGLLVPEVLSSDLDQGFMLLTDLGSRHFVDELNTSEPNRERAHELYGRAFHALHRLGQISSDHLPPYDAHLLMREMSLFSEWFLGALLDLASPDFLPDIMQQLTDQALQQPRRFVHRDFHSRNLMLVNSQVGLLDFQDAVEGPITYDLVSLLRDCYLAWPEAQITDWALSFAADEPELRCLPEKTFMRWFDWMGLQRHLKCAGIFCRLYFRDNKTRYLSDLPGVLDYLTRVASGYPELHQLADLLDGVRCEAERRIDQLLIQAG